jgi:hypothetical protein
MSQFDQPHGPNPTAPPMQPGQFGGIDDANRGLQYLMNISGWLTFLGVLTIIYGALMVLTIWGIIIAWLPIWIGVLLLQAGGRFKRAKQGSGMAEAADGARALAMGIKIWAITALVVLIIYAALIVIAGGAIIAGGMAGP